MGGPVDLFLLLGPSPSFPLPAPSSNKLLRRTDTETAIAKAKRAGGRQKGSLFVKETEPFRFWGIPQGGGRVGGSRQKGSRRLHKDAKPFLGAILFRGGPGRGSLRLPKER